MQEIRLVGQYSNLTTKVDDEDFEYLNSFRWYGLKQNGSNRYDKDAYDIAAYTKTNRFSGIWRDVSMTRLLLNIHNKSKSIQGDHKNHDVLDNQRQNIRCCTASQNNSNKGKRSVPNTTSEYIGVSWHKGAGKWRAYITQEGTVYHIGLFAHEKTAAMMRDLKAKELHGEFAYLNFRGDKN